MTSELKQRLETVLSIFSFDNLAAEVQSEIVPIKAEDGGESRGHARRQDSRWRTHEDRDFRWSHYHRGRGSCGDKLPD